MALAFGLTVLTMAYVIGHVSGCHLKPAVFIGLCVGGRFSGAELFPYILAHVAGGQAGFTTAAGFAAHGYGDRSPGKYPMLSGLVAEVVLTFFLLIIILGATDKRAPQGFAPIAIGLGLTLIHLIGVPVTNLSVNPARSTGPAVFVVGCSGCSGWRSSRAPCWRGCGLSPNGGQGNVVTRRPTIGKVDIPFPTATPGSQ